MIRISSLLTLLLVGCQSMPPQAAVEQQAFSWVEPGRTTRAEVIFALGAPRSVFEQDTILVYGVGCLSTAQCRAEPRRGLDGGDIGYQLILVFDAAGMLEQRLLLRDMPLPRVLAPTY